MGEIVTLQDYQEAAEREDVLADLDPAVLRPEFRSLANRVRRRLVESPVAPEQTRFNIAGIGRVDTQDLEEALATTQNVRNNPPEKFPLLRYRQMWDDEGFRSHAKEVYDLGPKGSFGAFIRAFRKAEMNVL